MGIEFIYPEFEVIRNEDRCTVCRACERQCANEVHSYDEELGVMKCDESKCVNCQRCVSFCPTRALKIVKTDCSLRENSNWQNNTIKEIYKQANSGGVLLSSMGNPKPFPVYWDKILINASQVTNPSIDPLREPMETRTYLGKKPQRVSRNAEGKLDCQLPPQLDLSMPVMVFCHELWFHQLQCPQIPLPWQPQNWESFTIPAKAVSTRILLYGENTIVQVASGRSASMKSI